jgi:maltooligosyltrehalose trehalohydrolase
MIPLLFMGEEYGETAPFQYFVSHGDADLVEAVRQGRREEFAAFAWKGEVPDPQDEATFQRSKLNRDLRQEPAHERLNAFYRECLRLRREIPALAWAEKETQEVVVWESDRVLAARCWTVDLAAFRYDESRFPAAYTSGGVVFGLGLDRGTMGRRRW